MVDRAWRLFFSVWLAAVAAPTLVEAKTVKVEMTAVETEVVIDGDGTTYSAWTFNNQFPGPVIRVQQGDMVDFTLTNASTNSRPHSMDFHAAQTDFMTHYRVIQDRRVVRVDRNLHGIKRHARLPAFAHRDNLARAGAQLVEHDQ